MKQVQVVVPAGEGWQIRDKLSKKFPYVSLVDGRTTDLLLFAVGVGQVQALLTVLDEQGVGKKHGEISIVEMISRIPRLPAIVTSGGRLADTELYDQIRGGGNLDATFVAYTILAALIATFGLIADNIFAVIASMIVAPLLGPIISTSYGLLIGETKIWKQAAMTEAFAIFLSILLGAVFAFILVGNSAASSFSLTGEMESRTAVSLLDIGIAVVGGLAAGVVTTEKERAGIIGIAVAASLMPPATNAGILFRLGFYDEMAGCFLLLLINLAAIHSATLLVFRLRGLKPTVQWKARVARKSIQRGIALVTFIVVLISLPIIYLGWQSYENWNTSMRVNGIVYNELEDRWEISQSSVKNLEIDIDSSSIKIFMILALKESVYENFDTEEKQQEVAQSIANRVERDINLDCWVSIQWIKSYS